MFQSALLLPSPADRFIKYLHHLICDIVATLHFINSLDLPIVLASIAVPTILGPVQVVIILNRGLNQGIHLAGREKPISIGRALFNTVTTALVKAASTNSIQRNSFHCRYCRLNNSVYVFGGMYVHYWNERIPAFCMCNIFIYVNTTYDSKTLILDWSKNGLSTPQARDS